MTYRLLIILLDVGIGLGFYIFFVFALRRNSFVGYVRRTQWLHPNEICYWRTVLAWIGALSFFWLNMWGVGVLCFTVSAFFDGIDGLVARATGLVSEYGKFLDPLCDKLTYLPVFVGFSDRGTLDHKLVWWFIGIEFVGQFVARLVLKIGKQGISANNFGKIKAAACFTLIIYLAVMEDQLKYHNFSNEFLSLCIILSLASIFTKFKIADVFSILNLICGLASMYFTYHENYVVATLLILAGQFFDLFDGRLADLFGKTILGPYLDDVADFVSFGLATGYLIWRQSDKEWMFGVLAVIYVLSIGYRLVRFTFRDAHDPSLPKNTFNGLPGPAGALIVLGACNLWHTWYPVMILIAFASLLMISHVRFVHFGRVMMTGISQVVIVICGLIFLVMTAQIWRYKEDMLLGGILIFSVSVYMLVGYIRARQLLKNHNP